MEEITRNDFSFFQNEILKEMKSIEKKLNEKILTISKDFQNKTLIIEQKYENEKVRMEELLKRIETENIQEKINEKIDKINSKLEETTMVNNIKISSIERDLSNACYKYDKIFINNISSPGLIGDGCPYHTMRSFLEFVNDKLKDLLSAKEKSSIDFKRYEDWVKSILNKFKEEISDNKNSMKNFLVNEIKQYDKRSFDKMNVVEDKLSFIRIENGKYNYNLSKKWEELEEKLKIFNVMNDNLINVYNNSRKEFALIKKKFNDLGDYFKDIQYNKNNINFKSIFDELSKKIKTNKLSTNESSKYNNKVLPSLEDISQIKSNKKNDNNPLQNFFERKNTPNRLLKKKTFQLDNKFGSSFNLKKNFYNKNYLNNTKNFNLLTESNNNINNMSNVVPKIIFEKKITQNEELHKNTDLQTSNDNYITKEKNETTPSVLKENKIVKENNINIIYIEEQNKENSIIKNKSIEINDEIKEEKENSETKSKNNNNEIIQEIDLHSNINRNNNITIDQKINSINKADNINNNNSTINSKKLVDDNDNNIQFNLSKNENNSNIDTKIKNIDEELNKVNIKFDSVYDNLKNKAMEIANQLNSLISKLNKIIFRKEDNIKRIREIDFYLERKKKNNFLNNSGICLPFSNNNSTDDNFKSNKKENYNRDNSFNALINKNNRNKSIYSTRLYFNNININKAKTKLSDSRSNSNNTNNNNINKNNNKNFYIRMIDPLSLSKIESYLIKKFTEPN